MTNLPVFQVVSELFPSLNRFSRPPTLVPGTGGHPSSHIKDLRKHSRSLCLVFRCPITAHFP